MDVVLASGATRRDLDPAWLESLGYLALEVDGQKAVLQVRGRDFDVIGKVEGLPKAADARALIPPTN